MGQLKFLGSIMLVVFAIMAASSLINYATTPKLSAEQQRLVNKELLSAAENNNFSQAKLALEHGADIKAINHNGWTPLMIALYNKKNFGVAHLLLDHGADVNFINNDAQWNSFHYALRYGDPNIVFAILNKGADINAPNKHGNTPLMFAAYNQNSDIVDELIRRGANINAQNKHGWTALMSAIKFNDAKIAQTLLNAKANVNLIDEELKTTPLMLAAEHQNADIIKQLIQQGAAINAQDKDGYTALMNAIQFNNADTVQALLDANADIKLTTKRLKHTALSMAAIYQNPDTINELIRKGADINHTNLNGHTPLALAIMYNKTQAVQLLLDAGADTSLLEKNNKTKTTLMLAARHANSEIINRLIQSGEEIDAQDRYGLTALTYAAIAKKTANVRALLDAGADKEHRTKQGKNACYFSFERGDKETMEILCTK